MNETFFNWVTIILATGASIQPMFIGFMFMMMFRYFPTRKEVELLETNQLARHHENQAIASKTDAKIAVIESDIKKLLQRHER
jgi:hypothetical protein